MKTKLAIGDKYGRFTIVGEAPKDRFGSRCYRCRCECGNEANYSVTVILGKPNRYCRKCVPHSGGCKRPNIVGTVVNGWEILEDNYDHPGVGYFFTCRCVRCGSISVKSTGQLNMSKSNRCERCPPIYNFVIKDGAGIGRLPDGTEFIVDEEDIPRTEKHFWRSEKEGYVVGKDQNTRLHRFIAGVDDPRVMVDHINRNRRDCRKANLRVITPFGNSCNHSLYCTNKTGYSGVYYSRSSGRYEVKIGYNHKRILLGSTRDENNLITLAQMYNIGAKFFFGEYAGTLNDVPDPPEELVKVITEKCQKYLKPSQTGAASAA